MTEVEDIVEAILRAKRKMEEAPVPELEKVVVYLTANLADELGVKQGDIVGTFAGRPVEVGFVKPLPIINLDGIDSDMKIFGAPDNYEKFFLHPAIITGEGKRVKICKNPEDA